MTDAFADAVVVAGGNSRRMDGVDKLDAALAGRPLLAWSVEAMAAARSVGRVVVVSAADRVERLRQAPWLRNVGAAVVAGGAERSDSVLAGVREASAEVVLVHDGARPLVTSDLADAVAQAAAEHGAAIPVLPMTDSLKAVDGPTIVGDVERDGLAAAQTPQAARRTLLLEAFAAAAGRSFSDEAGLLRARGVTVATVPGEATNLKVTRPDDLELVRAIAEARTGGPRTRTGFGQDSHQFGRHGGLRLGGTLIEQAPRLHGHSDGDVALHALATAVLSAAGLGDVGRRFPAGDASTAGAASSDLLSQVVRDAAYAGWRLTNANVSLVGSRPRLGHERLEAMAAAIAALLGLPPNGVAVTASTGNLSGADGAGRGISATAVVTLVAE